MNRASNTNGIEAAVHGVLANRYDALLIVGFGGPEKPEDVLPFLENVTRGRNIPRERLIEVAAHYDHLGGKSPINAQVRELLECAPTGAESPRHQPTDLLGQPQLASHAGRYASHHGPGWRSAGRWPSSCRRTAPIPVAGSTARTSSVPGTRSGPPRLGSIRRASSITIRSLSPPTATVSKKRWPRFPRMSGPRSIWPSRRTAFRSPWRGSSYETQLSETCRLVAAQISLPANRWSLVYQSRSGRPQDPWLEPDILDHLQHLKNQGVNRVIIHPIGFLSDHVEVLYDLDEEAHLLCEKLGLSMIRSQTVGTHPGFVRMLRELVGERLAGAPRKSGDSWVNSGPATTFAPSIAACRRAPPPPLTRGDSLSPGPLTVATATDPSPCLG